MINYLTFINKISKTDINENFIKDIKNWIKKLEDDRKQLIKG